MSCIGSIRRSRGQPEHRDPAHLGAVALIEAIHLELAPPARQPELRHEKDGVVALDDGLLDVLLERLRRPGCDDSSCHTSIPIARKPGGKVPSERRIRIVVRIADEDLHR